MKKNKDIKYTGFVSEIKQRIIQSRYQAARLANRELLMLYLHVGKRISEKIEAGKWGAKVLQQMSDDLQSELPGLRGFSERNFRNMSRFAEEYSDTLILPLITAKLKTPIRQSATAQLKKLKKENIIKENQVVSFFSISFTHHILILAKCKSKEERLFYVEMAASEMWSVSTLEYQITAKLYKHRGILPNNFKAVLPANMYSGALNAFNKYQQNVIPL